MKKNYEAPNAILVLFNGVRVMGASENPVPDFDPPTPQPDPPHSNPYPWQSY